MTAEIAILNKSAVALAADSAVTISAGSIEEKIFNTADKLFELSDENPIGVMIYNGMSFMEAPLPLLVKKFRKQCPKVDYLQDAATEFLRFLNNFGIDCAQEIKERHVLNLMHPIVDRIQKDTSDAIRKNIFDADVSPDNFVENVARITDEILLDLERAAASTSNASFFDSPSFQLSDKLLNTIKSLVDANFDGMGEEYRLRIGEVLQRSLLSDILSPGLTGIVIAGFGTKDMFPSLISFEIDGMVCNSLKHVKTNFVDIDRSVDSSCGKDKAKILPFAQREMVDRFLYGLDDEGQRDIENFARTTLAIIRNKLAEKYDFENAETEVKFTTDIKNLEEVFVKGLVEKAFIDIRTKSRQEIETMVEFMPKPDLAQMAEALVELTSIKRKVSRGMETVGGPIDVAIISQSEGFVWIKRKHYFPSDINPRYALKLRTARDQRESGNGTQP